jgi:hypothetical protein
MAIKPLGNKDTEGTLLYDIDNQLADNNAGLISAKDVRDTMFNLGESIPYIVASGDWESVGTQFISNLYLKTTVDEDTASGGIVIVESGIQFQSAEGGGELQVRAYPGPTGIKHNELDNLDLDSHLQYFNLDGSRTVQGNLGIEDNWINSSGNNVLSGHGLRFEHAAADEEIVHIGDDSYLKFDSDNSELRTGLSTAQAWINFSSVSGVTEGTTVTVNSSYNISMVERVMENGVPQAGKFRIYFKPNLFDNSLHISAIGTSNARQSNAVGEDFDQNTVSCVVRTPEYVTFYVQDDTNAFRDAEVNDLMVFGVPSGVTPDSAPVVRYQQS